jgi:hypothetical protein
MISSTVTFSLALVKESGTIFDEGRKVRIGHRSGQIIQVEDIQCWNNFRQKNS